MQNSTNTISLESKECITTMIESEFNKIEFSMEYIYEKAPKLIKAAKEFGLHDLAQSMQARI